MLVKEIQSRTVNYDGAESTYTDTYTYNGNKLVMRVAGYYYNTYIRYTYTGDLITKVTEGDMMYAWLEHQYEYDSNDRLIKETLVSQTASIENDLRVYSYNDDNSVIRQSYHNTVANPADLYETVKLYFDDANRFIKLETFDGTNWSLKNQITYNNNNSPFRNITGYSKLYMLVANTNLCETYKTYTNTSSYQYTVNNLGYPIQATEKNRSANGGVFYTTTSKYKY